MKTITIPFDFSMENCFWFGPEGTVIQLTAEVGLTDDEIRQFEQADKNLLKIEEPHIFQKIKVAINSVCKKVSYRYALINEFSENGVIHENVEKMMGVFEKEGLFVYKPDEPGIDPDKKTEFSIWLEEYFYDLTDERMVEFIEKYYGNTATRLTEEKLAYKYNI